MQASLVEKTMGHQYINLRSLLAVMRLALVAFASLSASAQTSSLDNKYPSVVVVDQAPVYRQFTGVEITGSSIIRKEQTQTLPVQVITRKDIQNSGVQELSEFLQKLPLMAGFTNAGLLLNTKGGYMSAALHGMSTGTLVLINGKRQAAFGRQTISGDERSGIDLDQLPLSAVDRIELLTDGASSLYGTDAIAGVVNIITQVEKQGLEMSVSTNLPDRMKGKSKKADLAYGQGSLTRDGYNWFIAADLEKREQLLGSDRPYASVGRQYFDHLGKQYYVDGTALTPYQSGVPTLATGTSAPYTKVWNSSYQQGTCPAGQLPMLGQSACLYNPYPDFGIYPELDAKRIYAKGSLQLEGNAVAYAEALYNDRRQQINNRVWDTYVSRIGSSTSDPGYGLALANGFTPGNTYLLFRPSELGAWAKSFNDSNSKLLVGLKGEWQGWRYNSALYQSQSVASTAIEGATYPNLGRSTDGLRTLTTDTRLRSLLSSEMDSQTMAGALLAARQFKPIEEGRTQIQALDFSATRTWFEWDGEPVLIGVGSELRRHQDQFTSFVALQQPDFMAHRTVFAQYAEVQWPVAQDVEVITALRNDHYSDFGNTTHGKVAAKWKPSAQWLVRGSMGSGFRAPTLGQMQDTSIYSSAFTSSNCTGQLNQLATQLTKAGGVQGYCGSNADGRMWIDTNGSSGLKPELSKQLSWGLQFAPSANHIWSADYWRVDMRDTLRQFPVSLVMSNPLLYSQYFRLDNEVNKGRLDLYLPMVNLGQSSKSGIDFSWSYRQPTDWGRFYTHIQGTRFLKSEQTITPELGTTSDLGKFSSSSVSVTPQFQMQWTAGLTQAEWNGQATVHYVSGYVDSDIRAQDAVTNQAVTLQGRKVPAFWTLDLAGTYQASKTFSLQASILNVLNKQAPLAFSQAVTTLNAYNMTYSNLWGRVVQLAMTVKF
jgi:iron complex outermembrane receptor protein